MLGLMYLGALAAYITILFLVARAIRRWSAARGSNKVLSILLPAFAIALIVLATFWQVIPTAIIHSRACERDAGFRQFQSPTDWAKEHSEALNALDNTKHQPKGKSIQTDDGFNRLVGIGGFVANDDKTTQEQRFGITHYRSEFRIVDLHANSVLATAINYSAGSREDARIWLSRSSCFAEKQNPVHELIKYSIAMKGRQK